MFSVPFSYSEFKPENKHESNWLAAVSNLSTNQNKPKKRKGEYALVVSESAALNFTYNYLKPLAISLQPDDQVVSIDIYHW